MARTPTKDELDALIDCVTTLELFQLLPPDRTAAELKALKTLLWEMMPRGRGEHGVPASHKVALFRICELEALGRGHDDPSAELNEEARRLGYNPRAFRAAYRRWKEEQRSAP